MVYCSPTFSPDKSLPSSPKSIHFLDKNYNQSPKDRSEEMATHAFFLRPSALLSAAAERARFHARSARRSLTFFAHPSAFSLPSNPSAFTPRISRNFASFSAHYALLLWLSLLAFLFPSHRATMLSLMLISKILLSYTVLLRLFPNSPFLRRILSPRIVAVAFLVVVVVQLALADAVVSLFLAVAAVAPIVVAHAAFRTADASLVAGVGESGKVGGDAVPVSGGGQDSDRSV